MSVRKQKAPEVIESELYDDEELIWWGQPIPSYAARNVNMLSIMMSLVMAAFAFGFIAFTQEMFADSPFRSSSRNSGMFSIISVMFILIPGVMFLGSIWQVISPLRNWFKATRTVYALTNKRAIIITHMLSRNVQSFHDEHVTKLQTRSYGGGVGDVIFATEQVTRQYRDHRNNGFHVTFGEGGTNFGFGPRTRTTTFQVNHGFMAIPDARVVEDFVSQVFFSDQDEGEKSKSS